MCICQPTLYIVNGEGFEDHLLYQCIHLISLCCQLGLLTSVNLVRSNCSLDNYSHSSSSDKAVKTDSFTTQRKKKQKREVSGSGKSVLYADQLRKYVVPQTEKKYFILRAY